jgi:hypothetical protein
MSIDFGWVWQGGFCYSNALFAAAVPRQCEIGKASLWSGTGSTSGVDSGQVLWMAEA